MYLEVLASFYGANYNTCPFCRSLCAVDCAALFMILVVVDDSCQ